MSAQTETLEFQAEARQLLQLMVHSIYSNKDIFLRELISNSSDALDKLRLESLLNKDLGADTSDLHIDLEIDKDARTLTVRDNGIGMSREEVVQLIGTIAKSGTEEFLRAHAASKEAKDAQSEALIGQFGVGFYSAFMVADKVCLLTRRAGESAGTRWVSTGDGTYTLERVDDAPQGTAVTLHLKPADTENHLYDYTSPWKVREIVKQHSDFIAWPIRMAKPETPDSHEDSEADSGSQVETVNSMKALWARPRSGVSDEEYHEFYKHVSHDWNDPLEIVHMRAEGTFEYQALLFIPSRAPLDLFMREHRSGVQLYVRRVFIMADCDALMPDYLRFVKGVVDAADLSLNVSREILQQDRQIQLIRKRLVKKVLSTIKDLHANKPEDYLTFWQTFGPAVKEGLVSDFDNRESILDISSFASTKDAAVDTGRLTTLREYIERMKEGQSKIYYLTGESRSILENSPHLEAFQAKGFEVLLLTDPIDEMWVDGVGEFDGRSFQSAAKGELDLGADAEDAGTDEREAANKDFEGMLGWMANTLQESVKQVRLSSRLTTSPACLVGDAGDLTPALEKMYRAMGRPVPPVKRVLELNPGHPLVTALRDTHRDNADEPGLAETAELLYGMAVLAEGGDLTDPARFTRLLADRLARTT